MSQTGARLFIFCFKNAKIVTEVFMQELKLTAVYEKADEGGYIAYVAELPGANTQGETIEEARENLKEAVALLLECYREEADNKVSTTLGSTKEELILQAA